MNNMHIESLDIAQVRLLAELLETHNLSLAAERVGLSQSAASHALARLRRRLGDPLFVRAAGGVQPTPYGEKLGLAARQARDTLIEGLARDRGFDPASSDRRFSIYLSDVGQMVLLPRLLGYLKRAAPGVSLRASPIPLTAPGEALASGEVDMAVGFFSNLATGFRRVGLFREHYVCVVRSDHPNFRAGMSLEAFQATDHALTEASGMAHAVIERVLAAHKVRSSVKLSVPHYFVLPMIIAGSDLAVIMPARLADAFAPHVGLQILPPPVPLPAYDIMAYWHERYHHDPASRWLRGALVRLFRQQAESANQAPGPGGRDKGAKTR